MDCALAPGVLAEALVGRSHDGIERVVFTNSGAEAIEAAIKFARHATKRNRIVYCGHGFHGLTTGALSLNGGGEFRDGFGPLLPADEIPFGDIDALARELRGGDVAAFVVEPIQGKSVSLASDDYWPQAQELCRAHKTLLVMDEVQTGLGRTGRFFGHEHWDVQPDIITVSKALSGGHVPVGAMLTSARVSDSVFSSMDRAVVHSSTFATNHLGTGHAPGIRRRRHRRPGPANGRGRHPSVALEAARMSITHMVFDDTRARQELGYAPRPAAQAVQDSARWFVAEGYVRSARKARISWSDDRACAGLTPGMDPGPFG
jgi:hypothetical protein